MYDPKTIRRLWKTGGAVAIFLLTLLVGNFFVPASERLSNGMMGHDFLAFYTAGTFVREGRQSDLYDLPKVKTFQHELAHKARLQIGESYGPFWNPPFYAWVFVPLSNLPYTTALAVWEAINAACLLAALALMIRMLDEGWTVRGLVPLAVCTSLPFIQAVTHGQNTLTSLLLLSAVVTLWRARWAFWAGAVAGLLFYKPQLGAVVAIGLIATTGWRSFYGLAVTGLVLLGVTLWTMPGALADYQRMMPGNLRLFQVENVYLWDRHVTLRAFWRLLIQGRSPGEMWIVTKALWLASCGAVVAGVAWAWWRARERRDLFIATVILAMPLVMPFYFDYDLLLIAVAGVLCAGVGPSVGRASLWVWVGLFFWTMVNSTVARRTGVNGTVLLLCGIEALLVYRMTVAETEEMPQRPLAMAA
jgi:alpha-1,2-mannosyltransferase